MPSGAQVSGFTLAKKSHAGFRFRFEAERTGAIWRNSEMEGKLKAHWSDDLNFYREMRFNLYGEIVEGVGRIKDLRKVEKKI